VVNAPQTLTPAQYMASLGPPPSLGTTKKYTVQGKPAGLITWPTIIQNVYQGFGKQSVSGKHTGWDFAVPAGSPVYASLSGKVVRTTPMDPFGWGNVIEIQSAGGFQEYYAHLSGFAVKPGETVFAGQEIGVSGNTWSPPGYSTGPHLHFEIRDPSGKPVDPSGFFTGQTIGQSEPAGYTIEARQAQQAMNANPAPLVNTSQAASTPPKLESPAASPGYTSLGSTPSTARTMATTSTSTPAASAPAAASSGAAVQSSGETVFSEWKLVDSPVLGKVSFKITPKIIAWVLGGALVLISLLLIGWKPIKNNLKITGNALEDLAKEAPKAAEAAA
jgi:hypothetical protein